MDIKNRIMISAMVVLMISFASAFLDTVNFDESYSKYGKIEINEWLGLVDKADYTLDSFDCSLIDCEIKGKYVLYQDLPLFDDLFYKDMKGNEKDFKYAQFYIKVNQSYQEKEIETKQICEDIKADNGTYQSCTTEKIGEKSITKYRESWKEYTQGDHPGEGSGEWKADFKRNLNERVDFIINANGHDLKEWAWWNSSWTRKKQITGFKNITNIVNISYDSDMQTDFDDLRFTNAAETGELNYWIESKVNGFWARVRIITTAESAYMYYGNSQVATTSRIINTMNGTPVIHFTADELSGDLINSRTAQFNLTPISSPTYGHKAKVNYSAGLDGNGDRFVNASSIDVGNLSFSTTSDFHVHFNINFTDADADNMIFTSRYTQPWYNCYLNSGVLGCQVATGGGADRVFIETTALNNGNLYSIDFIRNNSGTNYYIYVNGALNVSSLGAATKNALFNNFTLGDFRNDRVAAVNIEEFTIFNDTPEGGNQRIQRLYNISVASVTFGAETNLGPEITIYSPVNFYNSSSSQINFTASMVSGLTLTNITLIIDGIYNETNSSGINNTNYTFSKRIADGVHTFLFEGCDSNCGNSSIRIFTIDTTAPSINITEPLSIEYITNYSLYPYVNFSINYTLTEIHPSACWYEFNSTNTTITCGNNVSLTLKPFQNYTIRVWANDTFGFQSSATVYPSFLYRVLQNAVYFNTTSLEGNSESFILDFNTSTLTPSTGVLTFNGEMTTGSITTTGNRSNLTITRFLPDVNLTTNITFFFNITLSNGKVYNSTANSMNVSNFTLDNCGAGTIKLFNYTIVDEDTELKLTNTTSQLAINIYNLDRSVLVASFNSSFSTNPFAVCMNMNISGTYILDSTAKYQEENHSIEYYNIRGFFLRSNSTNQNITLADLNSSKATDFQLTFKGIRFLPEPEVLVYLDRQYLDQNVFKTVEVPITDANGQTVLHMIRNDQVYNLRFVKDGEILANRENIIAFCQDFTIGECKLTLDAEQSSSLIFNYDTEVGIVYPSPPTYNNNTSQVRFSYSSSDGSSKTVTMQVSRNDIFGNTSICNDTLTSASGTLTCTVPSDISETVLKGTVSVDGTPSVVNYMNISQSSYGDFGYIVWFLLTLAMLLVFGDTKEGLLFSLILSYIGAIVMGIALGSIIGVASAGIWLVIITLAALWKLNRERQQ